MAGSVAGFVDRAVGRAGWLANVMCGACKMTLLCKSVKVDGYVG